MARYIDLHTHTSFSDGTCSPGKLLELARLSGVAAFAVTDHDTVEGYRVLRSLVADDDPELVPGVELSVTVDNADMHLLAYLFDPDSEELHRALAEFQRRREDRGKLMVDRLNELGIDITYDDVYKQSGGSVTGRPHVARALHENKAIAYYEQAFEKYIGSNGPAYVPKANFTPEEAIDLIHRAGGLAILAHPAIDDKERHLDMLVGLGLDGIEVYHPSHSQSHIDRFKHLAQKHRLLPTGGSDFHGMNGRYEMVGAMKVPYEYLERLKEKKE